MKFRKKPIVIEASQFVIDEKPWPAGVVEESSYWQQTSHNRWRKFRIKTPEGYFQVQNGDWIITGVNGEKYPCKPDIFEKTYERVDDGI